MDHAYNFDNSVKVLKKPEFNHYIPGVIKEFEAEFGNLEQLIVDFSERVLIGTTTKSQASIQFSNNLKVCRISFPVDIFVDSKNVVIEPTPTSVFQSLSHVLKEAAKQRTSKCPECNGTGHIINIIDTQIKLGEEIKTLSSEKMPREKCSRCKGTGLIA